MIHNHPSEHGRNFLMLLHHIACRLREDEIDIERTNDAYT
jgi:hypothetical protein